MDFRPGTSQAELERMLYRHGRYALLEREFWNVVDGGKGGDGKDTYEVRKGNTQTN